MYTFKTEYTGFPEILNTLQLSEVPIVAITLLLLNALKFDYILLPKWLLKIKNNCGAIHRCNKKKKHCYLQTVYFLLYFQLSENSVHCFSNIKISFWSCEMNFGH